MKFQISLGQTLKDHHFETYDMALIGEVIDQRGVMATNHAKSISKHQKTVIYNYQTSQMLCDSISIDCDHFDSYLANYLGANILLDSTTLGIPEISIITKNYYQLGQTILSFLYLEPGGYKKPTYNPSLDKRLFDLSGKVELFKAIPGSVIMLRDDSITSAVFLVGFEGQRLDQAMEQLALLPSRTNIIFGVPAFQPGWEMDSFANHIRIIKERNIDGDILFAGAQNPKCVYDTLHSIYKALDSKQNERLVIFPIGTKPHAIGAALFSSIKTNVGLIFDNPTLMQNRSFDFTKWYLYKVHF